MYGRNRFASVRQISKDGRSETAALRGRTIKSTISKICGKLALARNPYTCRRWLDIVLLSFWGSLLSYMLYLLLYAMTGLSADERFRLLLVFLKENGVIPLGVFGFSVLLIVMVVSMLFLKLHEYNRLRYYVLYPPAWFAAVLPLAVFSFFYVFADKTGQSQESPLLLLFGVFLPLLIVKGIGLLINKFRHGREDDYNTSHTSSEETLRKFAENPDTMLIPWLLNDKPIEKPSDDLFDSMDYAQQVFDAVTSGRKFFSIGLFAPRGAGKSSVLKLVDHMLNKSQNFLNEYHSKWHRDIEENETGNRKPPPKIITCWTDAWGFSDDAVVKQVLRDAISELNRHVDCLALRRLPSEYLSALKECTPNWFYPPLSLAAAPLKPEEQIRRLDEIFKATNTKLLIFVEDVDRNVVSTDGGIILRELESLFYRLRQADSISFVVTLGKGEK